MGALDALKFSSLDLHDQGGLKVTRDLSADALKELGVEAAPAGAVTAELEFSVGGQEILLTGAVKGRWALECGRCLAPAAVAFSGALERVYPADVEVLDVSDEAREALALSVPFRALCREDCKGLCPRCGKNLNEGPCGCKLEPPNVFASLKNPKVSEKKRTN